MNPSPRILHLIDSFGPGGAETIFVQLATELLEDRWESVASVPREGWVAQALRSGGVEPVFIPSRGRFNFPYLRALVRLIRQQEVDLVHTHLFGAALYGGVAARICRIPVVSTLHGEPDLPLPGPGARLRHGVLRRAGNQVVLVSQALENAFSRRAPFPRDRTRVIHNGIDLARFSPGAGVRVRQELAIPPDGLLVGAIGNFRPAKALDDFVRAAHHLTRRSDRYHFLIAGETDDQIYPRVKALCESLGLSDRIHILGFRPDVEDVFRAMDVYASSSLQEGFSLTVVQAMATGVPVVATRSGGPEEIIADDVDGLLVEPGDPEALAERIDGLRTQPSLVQRFSQAGREAVNARFGLGEMGRAYEALYRELLAADPGPSSLRGPAGPAAEPGERSSG